MTKLFIFFYFIGGISVVAQPLVTDFTIENSGCKEQKLRINNLSSGAVFQEWDFCEADLLSTPTFSRNTFSLLQAVSPIDLRIKNENGQWYAFVCDGDGNRVVRLTYGNSLSNTPTQSVVGNFQIPTGVDLYKHNNNWYGLIGTFLTPTRLFLLEFGSSLENTPVIKQVNIGDSDVIKSRSIRIVNQGGDVVAFIANWEQAQITRIVFGPTFSSDPIAINHISLSSSFLIGLDVLEANDGRKILYATSYSNEIFSIDFSQDWKGIPIVNTVNTGSTSIVNPTMIDSEFEGGNYYLHLINNSGQLYQLNFSASPFSTTPIVSPLGNIGTLTNTRGFDLVRENGTYTGILSSFSDTNLSKLEFKSNCQANTPISILPNPEYVTFKSPGSFSATLRNFSSSILPRAKTISITISNNTSPDFFFETMQRCTASPNSFLVNSNIPLSSFNWNFGDGSLSNQSSPLHQFQSSGSYTINLVASSANGCSNYFHKQVTIYPPPAPFFTIPSGLICTNNQFNFINTTTDNFDGNLTYEWLLNEQPIATTRDLQYAFSTIGDQTVKLKTSIPGCTSESTQVISNVQAGPTVGFSVSGQCQDEPISFANTSSGAIAGFVWNLGNGESITQINPSKVYSTPGDYTVTLESQGTNGCVSKTSKIVSIYSKPQTDFSIDLPPFSCAGTPSQFKDLTPSMSDSNITSWQWNFGDAANNTATIKNPTHTYATAGAYSVSLQTTTNFGCSNTTQKSIAILPSPVASFTNGLACLNQNLQFVNSTAGIKSSSWTINNQQFSTLNPPIQRFTNPGNYEVRLTVTGLNNCQNTTTKVIQIKTPPLADFSIDAPCTQNATTLNNISTGGNDPLSAIQWDLGVTQLTGSKVNFTFVDPGIYGIRMNYLGQSGCTYTVTKNVSIVEGPAAKFTVSDEVGAAPLVVDFTNTSTPSNLQWEWNFKKANTLLFSSPFKNISFSFDELGEYTASLKATNSLNCISEFSLPIQVVIPQIRASLTDFKLVESGSGAKQALFTFENKSNVPISDPEIVMDVSGGPLIKERISGKFKPGEKVTSSLSTILLPRSLVYACAELFVKDDLQRDDDRKCLSLQNEPVLFAPYPNPVASEFRFEWISSTLDQAEVAVYNSSGQRVFSQQWSLIKIGLNQISISASEANLGDGLFYFTFQQGSLKKTFRFMVAKE